MLKRLLSIMVLFSALFISTSFAEDDSRIPPKPIENKLFDSLVGTWTGESNMFGTKMNDTLKVSWALNHQFLLTQLDAKSSTNPDQHYEGLGMFGDDRSGKIKTWWFDSWGAKTVSTGTAKVQNNQLVITDGSSHFKEERTLQVDGNKLTMHAKGTMKVNGKATPFEQTVVYTKVD